MIAFKAPPIPPIVAATNPANKPSSLNLLNPSSAPLTVSNTVNIILSGTRNAPRNFPIPFTPFVMLGNILPNLAKRPESIPLLFPTFEASFAVFPPPLKLDKKAGILSGALPPFCILANC